jgi:hypothetical protein
MDPFNQTYRRYDIGDLGETSADELGREIARL